MDFNFPFLGVVHVLSLLWQTKSNQLNILNSLLKFNFQNKLYKYNFYKK